MAHDHRGNCWDKKLVYNCKIDGKGNLCDVCHEHDEPRGQCTECRDCQACLDREARESVFGSQS